MNLSEQIQLLEHGAIEVLGRVAGSSNQALLVELTLNDQSALAIYKSERGERHLWDFPGGLWRREIAAFALDQALGTTLVPPTVARHDAPFGPGSLQWWVRDNGEDHYFTLRHDPALHDWFVDLVAFDAVANNADRKSGHVIFDGERCWAIDNGLCFHEDDKLRTVLWDFADEPIGATLRERLEHFADGEVGDLAAWITPSELALAQVRAGDVAALGRLPLPDEDRDWPPYPWPLI